jgi:hypothetical protein
MKAVYGLRSYYTSVFDETTLKTTIMPFMRDIMGVSDLLSSDIIKELRLQKEEKAPDGDVTRQMYERLTGLMAKLSKTDQNALK